MATDLFPTVYTAFPRKCTMVRCHLPNWRVTNDYAFRSADEAWRHEIDVARACRRPRPDPADYVIASGALTNDVDKNGAHLVIADWQHTYDPQSFYEEVERERLVVEGQSKALNAVLIIEEPKREAPECSNMSPPWFKDGGVTGTGATAATRTTASRGPPRAMPRSTPVRAAATSRLTLPGCRARARPPHRRPRSP